MSENSLEGFKNITPHKESIEEEGELFARSIAQKGNYYEILTVFKEKESLFGAQINRVREKTPAIEFMTDSDWEMLTVMELYDLGTYEHCLKTYLIAREKIEKVLANGIVLADFIKKENVTLDQFYRACLFHDIGKIEIPSFVLNNKVTRDEWREKLCSFAQKDIATQQRLVEEFGIREDVFGDSVELSKVLKEKNVKCPSFVPIKYGGLSSEEISELEQRNLSPEASLGSIIDLHQIYSGEIMDFSNFPVEARLVENHHNHDRRKTNEMSYPVSRSSLTISVELSDMLHVIDVQQAMAQKRSYKNYVPLLKAFAEIVRQTEIGEIGSWYVSYLWINDGMDDLSEEELSDPDSLDEVKIIRAFLESYKSDSSVSAVV